MTASSKCVGKERWLDCAGLLTQRCTHQKGWMMSPKCEVAGIHFQPPLASHLPPSRVSASRDALRSATRLIHAS